MSREELRMSPRCRTLQAATQYQFFALASRLGVQCKLFAPSDFCRTRNTF